MKIQGYPTENQVRYLVMKLVQYQSDHHNKISPITTMKLVFNHNEISLIITMKSVPSHSEIIMKSIRSSQWNLSQISENHNEINPKSQLNQSEISPISIRNHHQNSPIITMKSVWNQSHHHNLYANTNFPCS